MAPSDWWLQLGGSFNIHVAQLLLLRFSLNHNFTVSPCPGANCSVPLWVSDPTLALAPDSAVAGEGGGAGSLVGVVITVLVLSLAITVTVYYR